MNKALITAILDAGLIQFGAFARDGGVQPYWLRLDFMPSYPAALRLAADAVAQLVDAERVDRLVCAPDAVPLATLVSQSLNIPLVIHTGAPGGSQHTLVGAYDVGHSTTYITMTSTPPSATFSRLSGDAASVGLQFVQWVALLETAPQTEAVTAVSLHDVVAHLVETGEMQESLAARVVGL